VEQWARQPQGKCRGRADGRVSARTDVASMSVSPWTFLSSTEKGVVTVTEGVECLVFVSSNCVNGKLTTPRQALYTMFAVPYSAQIPSRSRG
jgi:hypothetical protein